MNKFDVSLLAGALLATDVNGRLWPGLPHKLGAGTKTRTWNEANKLGAGYQWDSFFTAIKADVPCSAKLKKFNGVMDLAGFVTVDKMITAINEGVYMFSTDFYTYMDTKDFTSDEKTTFGVVYQLFMQNIDNTRTAATDNASAKTMYDLAKPACTTTNFSSTCLKEFSATKVTDINKDGFLDITEYVQGTNCQLTKSARRLYSSDDIDEAVYYKDFFDEEDNYYC
jgi:hypothetical protein